MSGGGRGARAREIGRPRRGKAYNERRALHAIIVASSSGTTTRSAPPAREARILDGSRLRCCPTCAARRRAEPAMTPQAAVGRSLQFTRRLATRTRDVGLARTAGSLAFTTLLGLVPLATVAITFVARFPVFEQWLDALEGYLLQYMLPDSADAVVHTYIGEFTAKAAKLTGVSIAFIVVTAALMIATIEREINAIWGISQR